MDNWIPYKKNILVRPAKKEGVISETAKYWLYGEVIGVGTDVQDIQIGDTVAYDKFGIKDIDRNGEKVFFIKDDSDFILGLIPKHD